MSPVSRAGLFSRPAPGWRGHLPRKGGERVRRSGGKVNEHGSSRLPYTRVCTRAASSPRPGNWKQQARGVLSFHQIIPSVPRCVLGRCRGRNCHTPYHYPYLPQGIGGCANRTFPEFPITPSLHPLCPFLVSSLPPLLFTSELQIFCSTQAPNSPFGLRPVDRASSSSIRQESAVVVVVVTSRRTGHALIPLQRYRRIHAIDTCVISVDRTDLRLASTPALEAAPGLSSFCDLKSP